MTSHRPERPLVSVVLPTHDRPQLLAEAVRSVLRQAVLDWELVIVDDASTPPVDITADDARVRVVRNETSVGGAASKALGTRCTQGRYVTFLDDDDLFDPELLARAVAVLEADIGIDVLFVGVRWFGRQAAVSVAEQAESMQRVLRIAPPAQENNDVWTFDDRLFDALLHAIPMDFQRVVVRRSTLDRIGPHRPDCLMWDCDWALRAALTSRCALLRPGLYQQRANGQEYFSRPGRELAQMESALEMTLRLLRHPPAGTSVKALALLRSAASRHAGSLAYFHALHGPLGSSLAAWWRSQRLRPGAASPRLPFAALAYAARRRWRSDPVRT